MKENIVDSYRKHIRAYLTKNANFYNLDKVSEDEFNHVVIVASSVLMERDKIMVGGSFAQAIVENDLRGAIGRADATCVKHLKTFVLVNHNLERPL
jgi:hypothetical protein